MGAVVAEFCVEVASSAARASVIALIHSETCCGDSACK